MIFGTPPIITNGLVLHLDAGSRQSYVSGSTTWRDLSGNNNSGSLVNGPTFDSTNQGALVFNGTNQYANCGNISPLILSNNQFTTNYWLKMTGSARGDFFGIKNFNASADDIGFFIDTNNKLYAYFKVQGVATDNGVPAGNYASISNTTFTRNIIYNICAQKDASQKIAMYVNGILDNNTYSTVTNTSTVATSSLWIASNKSDAVTPALSFPGNIYLTSIYNRALSAQEVAQNYNALKSRFGLT